MSKLDNATTIALQNVQGSKFYLAKNEDGAKLTVKGGIGETNIPVEVTGTDTIEWASNAFTTMFLVSAIESLPKYARPRFVVSERKLLLIGEWEDKRGLAKVGTPRRLVFCLDTLDD